MNKTIRARTHYFAVLFLIIFIPIIYGRVIRHDFLNFDDDVFVAKNQHVVKGLTRESIRWAFSADLFYDALDADYWQPMTFLSRMLDVQLYGLHPGGHHFTNLLIHLLSSVFLFLAFRKMTGMVWRSLAAAAIFALHPLQVEPVAWVAARKDVLSVFFGIVTIWMYAGFVEKPSRVGNWFMTIPFALGLMSKPVLVTLPAILLLLDFWPLKRIQVHPFNKTSFKTAIFEKWHLFLISLASFLIAKFGQSGILSISTWSFQWKIVPVNYLYYIWKTAAPFHLTVYTEIPIETLTTFKIFGSLSLLIAVSFFVVRQAKKCPYLVVGWFWFLAAFIPGVGLIRADRHIYFSIIGLSVIFAWGIYDIFRHSVFGKFLFGITTATILAACMVLSYIQVGYWKNTVVYFEHALRVTKDNYQAYNNLGAFFADHGEENKAVEYLTKALSINPLFSDAHNNLGVVMSRRGALQVAEFHYKKAAQIDRSNPNIQLNLGNVFLDDKKLDEAASAYSSAIRAYPRFAGAYDGLGNAFLRQGKLEQAAAQFSKALEINPEFADAHHDLGFTLARLGNFEEAIPHFEKTLQIDPAYSDTHTKLGIIFALKGKYPEAIRHLQEALRVNPSDKIAAHNLELALKEQGSGRQNPPKLEFFIQ